MSFVSLLSFTGSSMPAKSLQSCPTLCDPRDYSPLGSSVHGDSLSKNTGVGLPCPPPGVLPDPGLNPCLLCLLHWQVGSLSLAPPGKPRTHRSNTKCFSNTGQGANLHITHRDCSLISGIVSENYGVPFRN